MVIDFKCIIIKHLIYQNWILIYNWLSSFRSYSGDFFNYSIIPLSFSHNTNLKIFNWNCFPFFVSFSYWKRPGLNNFIKCCINFKSDYFLLKFLSHFTHHYGFKNSVYQYFINTNNFKYLKISLMLDTKTLWMNFDFGWCFMTLFGLSEIHCED